MNQMQVVARKGPGAQANQARTIKSIDSIANLRIRYR